MDAGNNLADRTLTVSRTIAAPRALVFDAFTDPDHLARWWGPDGFTITTSAFDMRPGGVWRFIMHGPDGRDYQSRVVYDEIVPPQRLVFHHTGDAEPDLEKVHHSTTILFEDLGDRTRVTLTAVFPSVEECARVVREHHADKGGEQTLGRLASMLDEEFFVFTRRVAAPRETVWRMWTDAVHLARWWGPKNFEWISGTLDLRPGGVFHYGMKGPNDVAMWGKFVFHEIVPPQRLVYVSSFSDVEGGLTRAPWFADWPLEIYNELTLTADGDGTIITLRGAPIHASEAERARFRAMKGSMVQGFTGTFEQLEAYLQTGVGR